MPCTSVYKTPRDQPLRNRQAAARLPGYGSIAPVARDANESTPLSSAWRLLPPGILFQTGDRAGLAIVRGATTVTKAVADFVGSHTLVAVTRKKPLLGPAVNRPSAVIVPPMAVHVTRGLDIPITIT
jgi:hypothetical protein